jgi:hypothetical protein
MFSIILYVILLRLRQRNLRRIRSKSAKSGTHGGENGLDAHAGPSLLSRQPLPPLPIFPEKSTINHADFSGFLFPKFPK